MNTTVLGVCAALQIATGLVALATVAGMDLGMTHICFGIYIAIDIWKGPKP